MLKSDLISVAVILAAILMVAPVAYAESPRQASGDQAVRKAQYLLKQLSEEKNKLQAEKVQLQKELDDTKKKLAKTEKNVKRMDKTLGQSKASNNRLVERVKSDHEKMKGIIEKYRQLQQMMRVEKTNVALLRSAVEERNAWIDKCKANNDSLYEVNVDLLDQYKNKGFWQALKESEPATGLASVKLEVIADDYLYKIEDLQVADFKASDAANSPATSSVQ